MSGELGRALGLNPNSGLRPNSIIRTYKDIVVKIHNAGSEGYTPKLSEDNKIYRIMKLIDAGIAYQKEEGLHQVRCVASSEHTYKLTEVGENLAKKLLAEKETQGKSNKSDFLPFSRGYCEIDLKKVKAELEKLK